MNETVKGALFNSWQLVDSVQNTAQKKQWFIETEQELVSLNNQEKYNTYWESTNWKSNESSMLHN